MTALLDLELCPALNHLCTVSYTHLDVYKRQTLEHSLGTERSISVLFAISAAGMLACLWHARKNLPKI